MNTNYKVNKLKNLDKNNYISKMKIKNKKNSQNNSKLEYQFQKKKQRI